MDLAGGIQRRFDVNVRRTLQSLSVAG